MGRVTIILINYNNYLDTIECLESLLRIEFPDYQVIVIDNNSTNDSCGKIIGWLKGEIKPDLSSSNLKELVNPPLSKPVPYIYYDFICNEFLAKGEGVPVGSAVSSGQKVTMGLRLVLIRLSLNLGFSGANNIGIKFAMNNFPQEYFWFLNNDTVVEKSTLKEMLTTMNSGSTIGAVGSKILYYDKPDVIQCLGGGEIKWNYDISPYKGKRDSEPYDREITGYITGSSLLIKKEIVEKVGLWDEIFFMLFEDLDYSLRIRGCGYKLYLSARSRVFHKEGASTNRVITTKYFLGRETQRISFEGFYIVGYYGIRNWIYFNRKHKSLFLKISYCFLLLPFYFLGTIIFISIFDDKKIQRSKIVAAAFRDGLINKMGYAQIEERVFS
ncbi:MAG: glycosyltransferase family 2 protein [Candidatus Omnitrophica bacterium]|nr:glycosyltransferase family 2 protein [Candidatus Omnitrophota bacterium]